MSPVDSQWGLCSLTFSRTPAPKSLRCFLNTHHKVSWFRLCWFHRELEEYGFSDTGRQYMRNAGTRWGNLSLGRFRE